MDAIILQEYDRTVEYVEGRKTLLPWDSIIEDKIINQDSTYQVYAL